MISLLRPRISGVAALTASLGTALASGRIGGAALYAGAGVFLLAGGASALNQHQERGLDARMERTRRRPLPSGAIEPGMAFVLAILLVAAGGFVLLLPGGSLAPNLGLLAVAIYNGVYTPLKRRTAYALFAGAAAGALPPAIGWCMAGGDPLAPPILVLTAFSYLWQVPHTLLLMLRDRDDFARANVPSLTTELSGDQLRRIAASWLIATGAVPLLLPLFGIALPGMLYAVFAGLSGIVVVFALRIYEGRARRLPVGAVAAYAALVLTILTVERLWG